jgi:hypothetical protein
MAAEWPEHPAYKGIHDTIVHHLTVAEADIHVLDDIAETLEPELPIESRATEALLLKEGEDGFWRERCRLPLGAAARRPSRCLGEERSPSPRHL